MGQSSGCERSGARWRSRIGLLIGTFLIVGIGVSLGGGAGAQDSQTGERLVVNVIETTKQGTTKIKDVKIEVSKDGEVVLSGTTDDKGRYAATLPGDGTFEVKLVESSLPKGKTLPGSVENPTIVDTSAGTTSNVRNFQIGAGKANDGSITLKSFLKNTLIGIKFGLLIGLCAIGLSLIFGTTGLTNFAHGEMVTFGAAIALILNNSLHIPLLIAAPLAVIAGGLAGALSEVVVWRPLRDGHPSTLARGILTAVLAPLGLFLVIRVLISSGAAGDKIVIAGLLAAVFGGAIYGIWALKRNISTSLVGQLVVSIGLSIFFRYTLYLMIGGRTQYFRDFANQTEIKFGPFGLTPNDIFSIILAVVVLGGVGLMLERTRMGKAIRAVADNKALASASGIDVKRVILTVWVLGGAMAAIGGISLTLGTAGLKFDSGGLLLLLMFAGVTLGGLGTAYGALLGSILVGLLVQLSPLFFASDLKEVGALVVLVVILLVRPQGLLGKAQRVG